MAKTKQDQENLEELFANSQALAGGDLDLSEEELSEVFENAEGATGEVEAGEEEGMMEDFSLEREAEAREKSKTQPYNLDLLMDVELDVVIELGRTRKTIREVLHFGPGSIVELNKMAGETVDVFINDRLIAQGEVILFEDSLGVRITSIVTKEQLIRRLGK